MPSPLPAAAPPAAAPDDDRVLLRRFARTGDDAAFAALVARHGPLVLGVCRRVLRDPHAADDAFQAVFLVLARKAGRLRVGASLGSWLFGVARRVSLAARRRELRQKQKERGARGEDRGRNASLDPQSSTPAPAPIGTTCSGRWMRNWPGCRTGSAPRCWSATSARRRRTRRRRPSAGA